MLSLQLRLTHVTTYRIENQALAQKDTLVNQLTRFGQTDFENEMGPADGRDSEAPKKQTRDVNFHSGSPY